MNDAYAVNYCTGLAGEATTLADTRATGERAKSHTASAGDPASYPIVAATGVQDGEWAAIVAWTIDTLVQAETTETEWTLGGLNSLRVNAP